MARFTGFPDRAVAFYAELAADNTREFWAQHKGVYQSAVREPMLDLVAELEPEFGPAKVFRPHRDTRFSTDKAPYKTNQAAFAGRDLGIGFYVQLDARGLLAGGGFRAHSPAQVGRYREAVDDDGTGAELAGIVDDIVAAGCTLEGEQLQRVPRGYPADHPRRDVLRRKSLMAIKTFGTPSWLGGRQAYAEVCTAWRVVAPLSAWATAHVGPA